MNGAEMIAAERQRQIEVEGWTPEHDDEHDNGELIAASICYARIGCPYPSIRDSTSPLWPWDAKWWKPAFRHDKIRNLVKAGALIAAEIDRLQRLDGDRCEQQPNPTGPNPIARSKRPEFRESDCSGAFDGFSVSSDADSGL